MSRLKMAVIGVGHLGKEHARILAGLPQVELVGVADIDTEQAQAVARRVNTQAYTESWPLLNLVNAACIAVPTAEHAAVAAEFLRRGVPLLVEKPLAATLSQAEELHQLALENDTLLQVGHIERFNPAFQNLQARPLQPKFVRCERLGPYSGRSADTGAVLDLMIHDLDLLLALVGSSVRSVEALGVSVYGEPEDVANARLHFDNGCVADLTASRVSRSTVRRMHVWAPEGYARLDFGKRSLTLVQPSTHLRRHGLDPHKLDAASRACLKDELFTRHFETIEIEGGNHDQLTAELEHFVHCVQTGAKPRVGSAEACQAMALAQRVLGSIRTHQWLGIAEGPTGPRELPGPLGELFPTAARKMTG
jgi:predicted dehydrogenase